MNHTYVHTPWTARQRSEVRVVFGPRTALEFTGEAFEQPYPLARRGAFT